MGEDVRIKYSPRQAVQMSSNNDKKLVRQHGHHLSM
jgi:hydrogenase maturation factor